MKRNTDADIMYTRQTTGVIAICMLSLLMVGCDGPSANDKATVRDALNGNTTLKQKGGKIGTIEFESGDEGEWQFEAAIVNGEGNRIGMARGVLVKGRSTPVKPSHNMIMIGGGAVIQAPIEWD